MRRFYRCAYLIVLSITKLASWESNEQCIFNIKIIIHCNGAERLGLRSGDQGDIDKATAK